MSWHRRPGDRIGDWVVRRRLGKGGMGSVYCCEHAEANVPLRALKLVSLEKPATRIRFMREAEVLVSLDHPHLVKGYTFYTLEDGELGVLEMAWVDGEPVPKRLPERDVRRMMKEVGSAVAHLHQHGLAHRDIKPANILLSQDNGHFTVVDLGIVAGRDYTTLTRDDEVVGTVGYLPPEYFIGDEQDHQLRDIYALGLLAANTLAGRNHVPTKVNILRLVDYMRHATPIDVAQLASPELAALIAEATHPDPEQRLSQMRALVARARRPPRSATAPTVIRRPPEKSALPWVLLLVGGLTGLMFTAMMAAVLSYCSV